MRVLHCITPSRVSGAELLLIKLAQVQTRFGVTARILCKPHAGFEERARRAGLDVIVARISGKLNPRAVQTLCAEIRNFRPDVVCTHLSSASLWGALAARTCGIPCIAVVHGFNSAFCYRFAPHLVCVSKAVAEAMMVQRIPRSNIHIVHNGIDPGPFCAATRAKLAIPDDAYCVGTVAHLSPKKGYLELIEVAKNVPNAHFVVVGEGPLFSKMNEYASGVLAGRLHLLGFRDDIPALMKRFDTFCLPSRREPFGLVLLEAMAAEKPVVAFSDGGVPEVVTDGITGLLAPSGDVDGLAHCLRRLEQDAVLRMRLGLAGRQRVLSEFTLERTATRLQSLYRDVIDEQCAVTRR